MVNLNIREWRIAGQNMLDNMPDRHDAIHSGLLLISWELASDREHGLISLLQQRHM
jgi:hypothetical protein